MTRIEEMKRRAELHRQAAFILRDEVKRHDEAARGIDGGVSEAEAYELVMMLKLLTAKVQRGTLEYRLARLGVEAA